jgi:transcriptional regulator with XRE-family HTH domain
MFGKRLKELRKRNNLSRRELAEVADLSTSSVNMYERGERSPTLETLDKLASFFNVSTDYLLGRDNTNAVQHLKSADDSTKQENSYGEVLNGEIRCIRRII